MRAVRFLKRPQQRWISQLTCQMKEASESQDYNRASNLRDDIRALEHARQQQVVERENESNLDVLFFGENSVTALEIHAGALVGVQGPVAMSLEPSAVKAFLDERFESRPQTCFVVNLAWIRDRFGKCFPIYVPVGTSTPLRQLMAIAELNHAYRTSHQADPLTRD